MALNLNQEFRLTKGAAILLLAGVMAASGFGSYLAVGTSSPRVMGATSERYLAQADGNWFSNFFGAIFGRQQSRSGTKRQNQTVVPTVEITETPAPEVTESNSALTSTAVDLTKLPLGDKKYSTSAKQGYVYSCQTTFTGGGAFTQGPWIDTTNNTWDLTQKVYVDGAVSWANASWSVSSDGQTRTLKGNGLPINHTTGTYPIGKTDDAYSYDRNPNSISAQTLSLSLPANPTVQTTPQCVGGEVGIMLSGVPIFNAFDAGGRDAVATEVQDSCGGHPQESGQYHYHGYNACQQKVADEASGHSGLIGYAFDGFGIYGPKSVGGEEVSTVDLDECHGHTHEINWDGQTVSMFHYHLTYDFPYSVGCFRGQAKVKQSSSSGKSGGMMVSPTGGMMRGPSGAVQPSGMMGPSGSMMPPPPPPRY